MDKFDNWRAVVVQVTSLIVLGVVAVLAPDTRVAIASGLVGLIGAWSQRGRLVSEADLRRMTMPPPATPVAPYRAPMPSKTGFTDPPEEDK